jgi:hypothetical protein
VKSGKKLLSKNPKPAPNPISSPPKVAIAAATAKKDEVHRRRNPLNDILRRKSGEAVVAGNNTGALVKHAELDHVPDSGYEAAGVDARMVARVAELERALATAKEEQSSMREELGRAKSLRHQPCASSGAEEHSRGTTEDLEEYLDAQDSQQTHEAPQDHHSPGPSPDNILRQNHSLRHKLTRLQDQLAAQDIAHSNNLERTPPNNNNNNNKSDWNNLRSRLHNTEKESQERLQQLLSLKSSISSLTRTSSQATDSELRELFTQLHNRIREWVVSNFRRTKMDAASLPPETVKALKALTPAFESVETTERLALYQGLVSNAMMRVFTEPLLVGLSHVGPQAAIRGFAESIEGHGAEYREWRRVTIRAIESSEMGKSLMQGKNEVLHVIAGEIAHLLFTLTSVSLAFSAQSGLMGILNGAADLQRTLALQKARYQVLFFCEGVDDKHIDFDNRKMEAHDDFDSMDEDDVQDERQFLFCITPCLEKYGDEWGENAEVVNVLLKARVCCGFG